MLTCDQALELISASLDGPLPDDQRALLDAHLDCCGACRAILSDFETMHQLLPTLQVEPPAALKDNIMAQVRASKVTAFAAAAGHRRWRKQWGSLVAVLAVVLLGAGGLRLLQGPGTTGGSAAPAQPVMIQADAGGGGDEAAGGGAAETAAPREVPADVGGIAPAQANTVPEAGAAPMPGAFSIEPTTAPRLATVDSLPGEEEQVYCGIVVLSATDDLALSDYPWQQVDCELHYTLPAEDFRTLLTQVEGQDGVSVTLEGTGIAPDGTVGMVIVTPAEPLKTP